MEKLTDLENIGSTLAKKLNAIGVETELDLRLLGSERAILKIAAIEDSGACINMLYALEGAIQGIRWHNLSAGKKRELLDFYRLMVAK